MMNKSVREIFVPIAEYPHMEEDDLVRDAFRILKENFERGKGYRTVLVLNKKNQLRGGVSLADLIRAVEPGFLKTAKPDAYQGISIEEPELALIWQEAFSDQCKKEAGRPVKEIVVPIEAAVSADDSLSKAAYLMIRHQLRVIPVVDKDVVIGVVRLVDVFNEIAKIVLES